MYFYINLPAPFTHVVGSSFIIITCICKTHLVGSSSSSAAGKAANSIAILVLLRCPPDTPLDDTSPMRVLAHSVRPSASITASTYSHIWEDARRGWDGKGGDILGNYMRWSY